jgi:hypothetical protein
MTRGWRLTFSDYELDYVNKLKVEEDPTVDAFNSTFLSSL